MNKQQQPPQPKPKPPPRSQSTYHVCKRVPQRVLCAAISLTKGRDAGTPPRRHPEERRLGFPLPVEELHGDVRTGIPPGIGLGLISPCAFVCRRRPSLGFGWVQCFLDFSSFSVLWLSRSCSLLCVFISVPSVYLFDKSVGPIFVLFISFLVLFRFSFFSIFWNQNGGSCQERRV